MYESTNCVDFNFFYLQISAHLIKVRNSFIITLQAVEYHGILEIPIKFLQFCWPHIFVEIKLKKIMLIICLIGAKFEALGVHTIRSFSLLCYYARRSCDCSLSISL